MHRTGVHRAATLQARGIALWGILQSCEREGSLDAHITNEQLNDFNEFYSAYPTIRAVCFNGAKARIYYETLVVPRLIGDLSRLPPITLPSTSPANTNQSLSHKRAVWQEKLQAFL
jgi:TDG/mug DNA glycosylase family protein